MTWTAELQRGYRGYGYAVLLRHDCGYVVRRAYGQTAALRTYVCRRCYVRESFSLPFLPSYPT